MKQTANKESIKQMFQWLFILIFRSLEHYFQEAGRVVEIKKKQKPLYGWSQILLKSQKTVHRLCSPILILKLIYKKLCTNFSNLHMVIEREKRIV